MKPRNPRFAPGGVIGGLRACTPANTHL